MRLSFFQRIKNTADNAVQVVLDFVILKPQHAVALGLQVRCARLVIIALIKVLAAIQLEDELLLDAAEIHDAGTNGVLTPKADAQLVAAQGSP